MNISLFRVATIVSRIFKQIRRDRRTIGLMIIGPILLTFLFAYAFAGEIKHVPIAIANDDLEFDIVFGDEIVSEMKLNESFTLKEANSITVALDNLGVTTQAVIYFDEKFTQNIVTGKNVTLKVWINVSYEYFSPKISNFVSQSVSNVIERYFGKSGISFDFNVTIQQTTSIPPWISETIINVTVVNNDKGYNISIGDKIVDKLLHDDNVSVSLVQSRSESRESVEKEESIIGIWIPHNFTKNIFLRNESKIEVFINGVERDELAVALQAIINAIADSLSEITNKTTYSMEKEYIYGSEESAMIDFIGPSVMGFISMFFALIISGIFFLRERHFGTIERVLSTMTRPSEIIMGYLIAFIIVAVIQSSLVVLTMLFFSTNILKNLILIYIMVLLLAMGSVSIGIFISSYMRTELQVIQMIPIYIIPQLFLSGMIFPLRLLPEIFVPIAYVLPLTYYVSAVKKLVFMSATFLDIQLEFTILTAYFMLGLLLSIGKFRKTVE